MKRSMLLMCAGSAALSLTMTGQALADGQGPAASPAPAAPSPMPYPVVSPPLSANPSPASFDAGPILGKVTVDGVVSGLGLWQSNPQIDFFGDRTGRDEFGVANAQIIVNKSDGPVQFYIQAGAYSLPALGAPYVHAATQDENSFGFVPQGFLKLALSPAFSVEAGALPTLIGDEYTFTFENMNVERGLLWGQEPAVSKGVQVNYARGPLSVSLALTDGYYSGDYTSVSGLVSYAFTNADTLAFAAEGNAGTYSPPTALSAFATPPQQANGQIYNLIYTHTKGPLTISPYVQYSSSPSVPGVSAEGETWGGAVLAKWSFTPAFSLAGRFEFIASDGPANLLGYGVGSRAWSITLTPTYQKGVLFVRGEVSYVGVLSGTPGLMLGPAGLSDNQTRALVETGLIF